METGILKKKLSTFKSSKGTLSNVSNDLLLEVLKSWEEWPNSRVSFYTAIGVSYRQMAKLIGKAKKLKREGKVINENFSEIKLDAENNEIDSKVNLKNVKEVPIILNWDRRKTIRFYNVNHLIEFLKKMP